MLFGTVSPLKARLVVVTFEKTPKILGRFVVRPVPDLRDQMVSPERLGHFVTLAVPDLRNWVDSPGKI